MISGRRSTTPCSSSQRVRYQVAKTSRPLTAVTCTFLKISDSAMSSSIGPAGNPEQDDVAAVPDDAERVAAPRSPHRTSRTRRPVLRPRCARGTRPRCRRSRSTSADVGAERAGELEAVGKWSDASTRPAPEARAIAIVKRPTGPQPRTATVRPARSCVEVAKTALPKGSWSVAISGGSFERSFCHSTDSGTTTYSANAPSTSTPRICVCSHMCALPVRQLKHRPQVMWLSAET